MQQWLKDRNYKSQNCGRHSEDHGQSKIFDLPHFAIFKLVVLIEMYGSVRKSKTALHQLVKLALRNKLTVHTLPIDLSEFFLKKPDILRALKRV